MSSIRDVAHVFEHKGQAQEYCGMGFDGLPTHVEELDRWVCAGCGLEVFVEVWEDFDERTGRTTKMEGISDPRWIVPHEDMPMTCPLGVVLQVMES